jgi:hypothetical protein
MDAIPEEIVLQRFGVRKSAMLCRTRRAFSRDDPAKMYFSSRE